MAPVDYARALKKKKKEKKAQKEAASFANLSERNKQNRLNYQASQKEKKDNLLKNQQSKGIARPGVETNIVTLPSGANFDVNLPISSSDFANRKEYEQARNWKGLVNEEGKFPSQVQEQMQKTQEEVQRMEEEELPQRRELDVQREESFPEKIPVLGGIISAASNVILKKLNERRVSKGMEPIKGYSPEGLRTEALTAIEEQVYNEGLTSSEMFGGLIEGIPIVGSLISKYASGLVETPSGNVQTLVNTLRSERTRAANYNTMATSGLISQQAAIEQIDEIELNIQRLESRIRLLIMASPELKFNTDEINKIEEEILKSRDYVYKSKVNTLMNLPSIPSDDTIAENLY